MQKNNIESLSYIEFQPTAPATKSIIWLHGLGADGHDFAPVVPALNVLDTLHVRFIFPHAPIMPVTMNNGYEMRAWFDIYGLETHSKTDDEGIARAITQVNELIENEINRGIPANKIMLAGFSQGAVMAMLAGLHFHQSLAGIMALSGFLPDPPKIISSASAHNKKIPIFMAHGTHDMLVPFHLGEATHEAFKAKGFPIEWHTYNIAHTVSSEEIADIRKWLMARM